MCGSRDNLVLHQASSEVYQCSSMILRMCQSEEVERLRGMMFSDICRLMTMMQRCSGRDRAATRSTHGGHDSWVETVMSRRFHVPRFSLFLHLFRHYCLFRLSYHLSFLLLFPLCIKHHLKLDQGLFFISLVRPTSTPIGSPSSHQKIKYALPRILPSRVQTDFCTIQRPQYSPESRTLSSVPSSLLLEKGKLPEGFLVQPLNPLLRPDNPRTSLDLDSAFTLHNIRLSVRLPYDR